MASPEQLAALKAVVPAAQASQRRYGVPASVTLAQWIFESSWGTSDLARTCNNYFGIKAQQDAQPNTYREFVSAEFVDGRREEVASDFARYPDEMASFAAHARLLATAPRYKFAMSHAADPRAFARWLMACGYSTSPTYAQDLIDAMTEDDLFQYDVPPDGGAATQEVAA